MGVGKRIGKMRTSIALGVICLILGQLDYGEGSAIGVVDRKISVQNHHEVIKREANDTETTAETADYEDSDEESDEDSDEDSEESSEEDSSEESVESSSSSSSSEESNESGSSSSSSSEYDESNSDESDSDESKGDSSEEILKYKYKLLSPRSGIWTRNGVELHFAALRKSH